ncbi:MAG: type IV pilus modification protein PilV [Oceanococcus sp.]
MLVKPKILSDGPLFNQGFTLIEVLVSVVIFSIGIMGISALQLNLQTLHVDAYQRSQAILIMRSISERLVANPVNVAAYVTGTANPVGVGDALGADCENAADEVTRDMCEWSQLLKGAGESLGTDQVGAMIGARGCIEQIQVPDPTVSICTPGIYRLSIAWQGMNLTKAPNEIMACGANQFGDEKLRRIVTSTVTTGLNRCS